MWAWYQFTICEVNTKSPWNRKIQELKQHHENHTKNGNFRIFCPFKLKLKEFVAPFFSGCLIQGFRDMEPVVHLNGTTGKDVSNQVWHPKFTTQDSRGGTRKPVPSSSSLSWLPYACCVVYTFYLSPPLLPFWLPSISNTHTTHIHTYIHTWAKK